MHQQAVRRPPSFFAERARRRAIAARLRAIAAWYRGLDLQTQADAAFGALVVIGFFVAGMLLPAVCP